MFILKHELAGWDWAAYEWAVRVNQIQTCHSLEKDPKTSVPLSLTAKETG